jgi:hypothetical protein
MLAKEDGEHPIPEHLRPTFRQIAAAFAAGDFELRETRVDGVLVIDADTANAIAGNIAAYGSALAPLSEDTWQRSIYRWMDGYWQALVDLSTIDETVSDLTVHAMIFGDDKLSLRVESVHVP